MFVCLFVCFFIMDKIQTENFPNMGEKKTVTQVQEVQSLIQDRPREEHCETHVNQVDIKTKKNLKAIRKKQQIT